MAETTIRVGEEKVIHASLSVGGRPAGASVAWTTSDGTKVAIVRQLAARCVVRGVATGSATVSGTVDAGGDIEIGQITVNVIGKGAVDTVTLEPGF